MIASGTYNRDYRSWLLSEWDRRRASNPAFSMRAFARHLGVGVATLSEVLGGKRNLSRRNALKIAQSLMLGPEDTRRLVGAVDARPAAGETVAPELEIEEDAFRLIADWYHNAILALATLAENSSDPAWIARRLGIPVAHARLALERLCRLDYLRVEDGRMINVSGFVSKTRGIPSVAVRRHHKQQLKLAERSLDVDPVDRRDFSAMTIAVNPDQIDEARRLIAAFRQDMKRLMQHGPQSVVYTLAVQLFPVSKHKGAKQ